jgi:hypothetical protein
MATDSTTFTLEQPSLLMRWLLPSVGDLIFVALFCLLVFTNLSTRLLGDAGIGWHIRTGQIILSTHSVPRVDPFSSSMAGRPWFAWEWLYDVIVGWSEGASGLNGVVVFAAFIIALTFSLAFRLLLRRGTDLGLALVLMLLAASASMIHFFARPHVVTWLFTLLWFWILDSSERNAGAVHSYSGGRPPSKKASRSSLWLLPVTMLLWVNIHGGFLIGLVLLAIYWFVAVWACLRPAKNDFDEALTKIRAGRHVRNLISVGVCSLAVTLINPYGAQLHLHIYRYLSNRFLMNHIDEFQSPNFHYVAQKCFAALVLLTLIALAAKGPARRELALSEGLLTLFAVYSGLYASRNIPTSSLLLILIAGPRLSDAIAGISEQQRLVGVFRVLRTPTRFFKRMQAIQGVLRGHLLPVSALLLTYLIAMHGGNLDSRTLISAHFDDKRFPAGAVNYIEARSLTGPVFSPDAWGGYLIYRLYPRAKVVIDDRHDFYGEPFLKSYLKSIHVEPDWRVFLDQHPAQYLILPKGSALANILVETADWKLTYRDDVAVVFAPLQQDRN